MKTWMQQFLTDLIDNDTLIIGGLLLMSIVYMIVSKQTDLARDVAIGLIGYMGKALQPKGE